MSPYGWQQFYESNLGDGVREQILKVKVRNNDGPCTDWWDWWGEKGTERDFHTLYLKFVFTAVNTESGAHNWRYPLKLTVTPLKLVKFVKDAGGKKSKK